MADTIKKVSKKQAFPCRPDILIAHLAVEYSECRLHNYENSIYLSLAISKT